MSFLFANQKDLKHIVIKQEDKNKLFLLFGNVFANVVVLNGKKEVVDELRADGAEDINKTITELISRNLKAGGEFMTDEAISFAKKTIIAEFFSRTPSNSNEWFYDYFVAYFCDLDEELEPDSHIEVTMLYEFHTAESISEKMSKQHRSFLHFKSLVEFNDNIEH